MPPLGAKRRLGRERLPLKESDAPPAWGFFPVEQYLIRNWDHTSSLAPCEQRRNLIHCFILEEALEPELFTAVPEGGTVSRVPSDDEVRVILEPWRPARLRKVARVLVDFLFRYQNSPVFARTHYVGGSTDEQKMTEWLADDDGLTSEPPVKEEDLWWKLLNDESFFNVGEEWTRTYDLVPEIVKPARDRAFMPNMTAVLQGVDKHRILWATRQEQIADAVQYEAFSGASLVLFDKEFFETSKARLVFLDKKGNAVRSSRIIADDIASLDMAHFRGTLRNQDYWEQGEVGPKYKSAGEIGRKFYGLTGGES